MSLEEYRRKRDFSETPEPRGDGPPRPPSASTGEHSRQWDSLPAGRRFCVQQHRATRMHWDLRLEHGGVLLSWPIPRGPTLDPRRRRLAVQTEDHPVDYGAFEGVIPSGYGAGTVLLWDMGTYEWVRESATDVDASYASGNLKFRLFGEKLRGEFALVRLGDRGRRPSAGGGSAERNWLLIKKRDEAAVEGYEAVDHEVSVATSRTLAQIAADGGGDPRERARQQRRQARPQAAGGTQAPLPSRLQGPLPEPMLAMTAEGPFDRPGWFYEVKWDGVRIVAGVDLQHARLEGRRGHRDETARYPEVCAALVRALPGHSAVVDGEVVVLDADGRPSFERLQSRMNVSRQSDVQRAAQAQPATYVVFDLLELDGRDLTETPLRIRKKTLREALRDGPGVLFADHVEGEGLAFFDAVAAGGLEGMMAKRADSPYQPGRRSPDWQKVKAWMTQDCVIAGFTAGRGRRAHEIGALVLGVHGPDGLVHAGQVGTGLNAATLRRLREELAGRALPSSPLVTVPRTAEPVTWVRPELVCRVRHAGWTARGVLRHPAFVGLRDDVDAASVRREGEAASPPPKDADGPAAPAAGGARGRPRRRASPSSRPPAASGQPHVDELLEQLAALPASGSLLIDGRRLPLTNLDKPMWPEDGLTKRDLVAHYLRVSEVLLPHLRDRPLSMQVFPDGIHGKSFWRKDAPAHAPDWITTWTYHGEKTKDYVVVDHLATLLWVANAASIDLHPWHSRIDEPLLPDWAVFDLDPAEGASFESVVVLARLVGVALQHYGLRSVLKTTGQTGLQVYVPITRGPSYGDVLHWVEGVSRAVGRAAPDLVSWEWTVSRRGGRVRLDYTQNLINKTLAAPYSVRPAPRAPVSAPLRWEELDDPDLRPDRWTMASIGGRIAEFGDLFAAALADSQVLPPLD
ncbi:MAG: DNA ligase D [Candidatus Dormibacteria bacterium]